MPNTNQREIIIMGTGHRPPKIGGYPPCRTHDLIYTWTRSCLATAKQSYDQVWYVAGAALGFDQISMRAAVDEGVRVLAALPFANQHRVWSKKSQDDWWLLLARVERIYLVNQQRRVTIDELIAAQAEEAQFSYSVVDRLMKARNTWMTTKAQMQLAVWDGSTGGTKHAVDAAIASPNITQILRFNPKTGAQDILKGTVIPGGAPVNGTLPAPDAPPAAEGRRLRPSTGFSPRWHPPTGRE